jgi:hypothetical protein
LRARADLVDELLKYVFKVYMLIAAAEYGCTMVARATFTNQPK